MSPCSALDPIATAKIEELIDELAGQYTIVIVTHNMQQGRARVGQHGIHVFGSLIEYGDTEVVFQTPKSTRTQIMSQAVSADR